MSSKHLIVSLRAFAEKDKLSLRFHGGSSKEEASKTELRDFCTEAQEKLRDITDEYDDCKWSGSIHDMQDLGERLSEWLDAKRLWLQRLLLISRHRPILLYVHDPKGRLISAPWELLVHPKIWKAKTTGQNDTRTRPDHTRGDEIDHDHHWMRPTERFLCVSKITVIRCPAGFGPHRNDLPPPSTEFYRDKSLTVVNLGAAPSAAKRVDVHRLERRLDRDGDEAIDFHFLSTGTLKELSNLVNRLHRVSASSDDWPPEVVQISARGGFSESGEPAVLLEDEQEPRAVKRAFDADIAGALPDQRRPRLLFLWAGHSAGDTVSELSAWNRSLCSRLAARGFENILGLAGGVDDEPAADFAIEYYSSLAKLNNMYSAMFKARRSAIESEQNSPMWHLVRWFTDLEHREMRVDTRKVEPHSRLRKRSESTVGMGLRVERRMVTHALIEGKNVILHGPHGQGKSTILSWLPSALHRWRFVHMPKDEPLTSDAVVGRLECLRDLLAGAGNALAMNPSVGSGRHHDIQSLLHSGIMKDPIILVIDNFEKDLDLRFEDDHPQFAIRAEALEALHAVTKAFATRDAGEPSASRIIIASAYGFDSRQINSCDPNWKKICVPGLGYGEVLHHMRREWSNGSPKGWGNEKLNPSLILEVEELCMGNFEILRRLLSDGSERMDSKDAFESRKKRIMTAHDIIGTAKFMWFNRDTCPESRRMSKFLMRGLREARLLDHVNEHQICRGFLRRMCYLGVPVPEVLARNILVDKGVPSGNRDELESMINLGIIERVPDLVKSNEQAVQINRLYREALRGMRKGNGQFFVQETWTKNVWVSFMDEISRLWCDHMNENRLGCLHAAHAVVGWVFGLEQYSFDIGGLEKWSSDAGEQKAKDDVITGLRAKEVPSKEIRVAIGDPTRTRVKKIVPHAFLYHIYRDKEGAEKYATALYGVTGGQPLANMSAYKFYVEHWTDEYKAICTSDNDCIPGKETLERVKSEARKYLDNAEELDTRRLVDDLGRWEVLPLEIIVRATANGLAGYNDPGPGPFRTQRENE